MLGLLSYQLLFASRSQWDVQRNSIVVRQSLVEIMHALLQEGQAGSGNIFTGKTEF